MKRLFYLPLLTLALAACSDDEVTLPASPGTGADAGYVGRAVGNFSAADWQPGGPPGTTHLGESPVVARMVTAAASQGKKVAAICAAPTVLAKLGLLNGREAVCYPSCRENLAGAVQSAQPVVVSGRFITGEALGSAIPFALELAAQLTGRANAEAVAKAICYNW